MSLPKRTINVDYAAMHDVAPTVRFQGVLYRLAKARLAPQGRVLATYKLL